MRAAGAIAEGEGDAARQLGARVARDGDVVEVLRLQVGGVEAVLHRTDGKGGVVLDACEALLFGRSDDVAVDDDGRGGVAVVRVDAEDVHGLGRIPLLIRVCSEPAGPSATAVTILAGPSRLTSARISLVTNRKIELHRRIETRVARVAVVGLGYVGLPLSVAIAEAGMTVVGIDVSPERVEAIATGVSPIADVDSDLLSRLVESRSLTASTDVSRVAEVDVVLIAVPTPIDERRVPDLSSVTAAAKVVAEHIRPGVLVVLESTTYPGTTEEVVIPEFVARGFRPGLDLYFGYSPERIDPGNPTWHMGKHPGRLPCGLTTHCP